ncbi:MAG: FAD-dependent oxidoreductase, partial [Deltaproteobacteria bacterium]|nr:FAD-dependent oxidoreductase [Nannocystaceae bacterium]
MSSDADPALGTSSGLGPNPGLDADVVVLGASFAGIEVLYQLQRRASSPPPRVIVVDRERRHGYLPLVQERLLGTIDARSSTLESAAWIDSVEGARFVQGEIVGLDVARGEVTLEGGTTVRGRVIVVALGSVLEPPPALPGAARMIGYKSGAQFEQARAAVQDLLEGDAEERRIVVVGGGISGVELAGELAALRTATPPRFRHAPEVTLIGVEPALVPILGEKVGARAHAILVAQGVDVRTGTRLEATHEGGVSVREHRPGGDESLEIAAGLVMWAGGVRPSPVLTELGLPRTEDGWLAVGPTLQCYPTDPARAGVFACGDAVRIIGGTGRWPTMQRAIECIWQAKVVAKNVLALLAPRSADAPEPPPLHPHRLRK